MRNLHLHIREEYGIENVKIFWRWEKLEYKMAAFQNHRIFSLRCLKEDLVPVSVKLKSNIKTSKSKIITKKVERAMLNDRIRSINNTIAMATSKRDTCMNTLLDIFSKEIMEECAKFINLRREAYYMKVNIDKKPSWNDCAIKMEVATQTSNMVDMADKNKMIQVPQAVIPKQLGKTQKRLQILKKDGLSIYQVNP